MKNKNRILFLAISSIESSFLNRLISKVKILSGEKEFEISVLLLATFNQFIFDRKKILMFKSKFSSWRVKTYIFPGRIEGANPLVQLVSFPFRLLFFFYVLVRCLPDTIHAHSTEAGMIALLFRPIFGYKMTMELHGHVVEEIGLKKNRWHTPLSKFLKDVQQFLCLRYADFVIYASAALKIAIEKRYDLPGKNTSVIPSGIIISDYRDFKIHRKRIRGELHLANRFVVVFSGDFHGWQTVDDIILWFKFLAEIVPNSFFLVLTNHPVIEVSRLILKSWVNHQERIKILSLSREDVPIYLPAADLGLLIRRRNIVNRVASPLKFSEYLAAGVPVLATRWVDQVKRDIINTPEVGFLVNSDPNSTRKTNRAGLIKFIEKVKRERNRRAQLCHDYAKSRYDWNIGYEKIINQYKS